MLHSLSRLRLRKVSSGMLMHFMPTVKKPSTDLSEILKAIYVLDRSRFSIVIAFFFEEFGWRRISNRRESFQNLVGNRVAVIC